MFSPSDIESLTSSTKESNGFVVIKDDGFEDIVDDLFSEVQLLRDKMRPARMSRGPDTWEDDSIRGDSLCWVTPELCEELKLTCLDQFITRLLNECNVMQSELGLTNEYNIQFAMYPGKGEGYNRHRDAFPQKCGAGGGDDASRQLTCLLYLNREWVPEDGGQLRVFTLPRVHIEGAGEPFGFWGVSGYDIEPSFGRLIVFRSELVDHAVLPCHRERAALTFWINGTGPQSDISLKSTVAETLFKFTAPLLGQDADSSRDSSEEENA